MQDDDSALLATLSREVMALRDQIGSLRFELSAAKALAVFFLLVGIAAALANPAIARWLREAFGCC